MAALVFGKKVRVEKYGYDQYQRTIGDVFLANRTNVKHELVRSGWCCWYRKYAAGNTMLEKLEMEAREAGKGLWADQMPVPPWDRRKRN